MRERLELQYDSLPLYGRNNELRHLETTFNDVRETVVIRSDGSVSTEGPRSSRVLAVSGKQGTGKTRLLDTWSNVSKPPCFFCTSSYQETGVETEIHAVSGTDAYETFKLALRQLLLQIRDDRSVDWKRRFRENTQLRGSLWLLSSFDKSSREMFDMAESDSESEEEEEGEELESPMAEEFHRTMILQKQRSMVLQKRSSILRMGQKGMSSFRGLWSTVRIREAMLKVFRFVSSLHMVVLVQEDLHFAPPAALDVLQSFIDTINQNFMLVVSHRDFQDEDSSLSAFLQRNKATLGPSFIPVYLENLELHSICDIVARLTYQNRERSMELARVLQSRTSGNPFELLQLLRLLRERKLIFYNMNRLYWEWNLKGILVKTKAGKDHADIVAGKIRQLPNELRDVVTTASFFGSSTFSSKVLLHVLESSTHSTRGWQGREPEELQELLDEAVMEGLLEPLGNENGEKLYHFTHHRIRETAQQLVLTESNSIHYRIGTSLMALLEMEYDNQSDQRAALVTPDQQSGLFLLAAHHLNQGQANLDEAEKLQLVESNYKAAEYALEMLALFPAAEFLKEGLSLLGPLKQRWTDHYDVSLKMTTRYVLTLYSCGQILDSLGRIGEVMRFGRTLEDKIPVIVLKVQCLIHVGRVHEAIELALESTKEIKVIALPRNKSYWLAGMRNLMQIKRTMRKTTDDLLFEINKHEDNRPACLDMCLDFLKLVVETSFLSGQSIGVRMFGSSSLVLLVLKHGSSKYAGLAMSYCSLLYAGTGDYAMAEKFRQIALPLIAKGDDKMVNTHSLLVLTYFGSHWCRPLAECLEGAVRAKEDALGSGDVQNLYTSFICYIRTYLQCGLALKPLLDDMLKMHEIFSDLGHTTYMSLFEVNLQYVMNLMGQNDDPLVLTGQAMNEERSMERYERNMHYEAFRSMYLVRMFLGYYFYNTTLALDMSEQLGNHLEDGPNPMIPVRLLFQGLIAVQAFRSTKQKKYIKQSRKYLGFLEGMLKKKCVNVLHLALLLKAECFAIAENPSKAFESFRNAIVSAGKVGFTQHQALANELLGSFHLELGHHEDAQTYLTRAWILYTSWGAVAKAEALRMKFRSHIDTSDMENLDSGMGIKARERFEELSHKSYYGSELGLSVASSVRTSRRFDQNGHF